MSIFGFDRLAALAAEAVGSLFKGGSPYKGIRGEGIDKVLTKVRILFLGSVDKGTIAEETMSKIMDLYDIRMLKVYEELNGLLNNIQSLGNNTANARIIQELIRLEIAVGALVAEIAVANFVLAGKDKGKDLKSFIDKLQKAVNKIVSESMENPVNETKVYYLKETDRVSDIDLKKTISEYDTGGYLSTIKLNKGIPSTSKNLSALIEPIDNAIHELHLKSKEAEEEFK